MEWGGDLAIATLDEHGREDIKGVVNVPIVEDKLGREAVRCSDQELTAAMYNTTLNQDVACDDDRHNYGFAARSGSPASNLISSWHYEKDERRE